MGDLYFKNKQDFEQFIVGKEKIGNGVEGTCYKIDNHILKIYGNSLNKTTGMHDDSYYLQFKNIDVDNFHFIKNLAYIKNEESKYLIGTIGDYIEGTTLDYKTLYHTDIDGIIDGIGELIPSIKKLSKSYICIGDIFIKNIIYNKGHFHFIDTASYYYVDEYPYYIYKHNIITIMKELTEGATGSYSNRLINNYLFKINNEFNYHYDVDLLLDPINLLKGLRKSLEDYCNKPIIRFSDSEQVLKKKLQYY